MSITSTTVPTPRGAKSVAPKPAEDATASGALIDDGSDADHPALDNDPRAGGPASSNQIDFNDPTLTQAEAVAQKLGVASADEDK